MKFLRFAGLVLGGVLLVSGVANAAVMFADNPTQTPTDFISYLGRASGPVVLAVIVIGAIKEWWVPGATHRRMVQERDDLLQLALRSQEVGHRALDTAEKVIKQ